MLTIHLKDGSKIEIPKFDKVSYWSGGTFKEIPKENFNKLIIGNEKTFCFLGSFTVSIKGYEILYLELH